MLGSVTLLDQRPETQWWTPTQRPQHTWQRPTPTTTTTTTTTTAYWWYPSTAKREFFRRLTSDIGANYLQSVFWTLNFAKKYWISMKILSPKILDFYENTCQNTGLL